MKNRATELVRSVVRSARHRTAKILDEQIRKRTGLIPIGETDPNDVFICGYPKSGNTWFQYIVSALVYGADAEFVPDVVVNDLVPDVHFRRYYHRYGRSCFFKTHDLPRVAYRRIVYLMRDGRDAMVSYYHFMAAMSGPVDFHDMVKNGRGLPGKWHEHVEAYQANPYGAQMIVIRYEDLKRDTVVQLQRFCNFVGLERSEAQLRHVAETTTFDKMRIKEQRDGWDTTTWPKDKSFFVRRGAVGSFKDEMPTSVLKAFMDDAERTLASQGYVSVGTDTQ
jgi:hypothetical protein